MSLRPDQLVDALHEALSTGDLDLALQLEAQGGARAEVTSNPRFKILQQRLHELTSLGALRSIGHDVTWDVRFHVGERHAEIVSCATTPDATTTAVLLRRGGMLLWRKGASAPELIVTTAEDPVRLVLSESGGRVLVQLRGRSVPVWMLGEPPRLAGVLEDHPRHVTACALRSDGRVAWTAARGIHQWSTLTRRSERHLDRQTRSPGIALAATSQGRFLYVLSASGEIAKHDLETRRETRVSTVVEHMTLLTADAMCLSFNENRLMVLVRLVGRPPLLVVLDARSLTRIKSLPISHLDPSSSGPPSLCCDAHGELVAMAGGGLAPQLLDLATDRCHLLPVRARCLSLSSRGELLVAAAGASVHRFHVVRERIAPPRDIEPRLTPHIDALLLRLSTRASVMGGLRQLDDEDFAWLMRRVHDAALPCSDETLRLELERRAASYRPRSP